MRKLAFTLYVILFLTGGFTAKANLLGRDVSFASSLGDSAVASQREVHDEVGKMLKPLVEVMRKSEAWQRKVLIGLMTGRIKISEIPEKALHLSEQHREMFLFCAELFAIMSEDFGGKPSYERGYIMGRGLFEVGSLFLAPETVGAKFTKLKYLEAIKLKAGSGCKWLSAAGVAKLEALLQKMRTARMCFVAGTPVWTADGLRAIERLSAGDQVMSRDERTGRQEFRPVRATIVTHPAALVHVRHAGHSRHGGGEASGDADAEEELVCTPEHPFYVMNRAVPGFVEAGELRVGDAFRLVNGEPAEVRGLRTELAQKGKSFTTYNVEVADFHTYFVGANGVWVHNFSTKFCEEFFTLARLIQHELGIADNALLGERFRILEIAFGDKKYAKQAIKSIECDQAMHASQMDEFAEYATQYGAAPPNPSAANNPANKIASVDKQKKLREFAETDAKVTRAHQIHHTAEKRISKAMGIPDDPAILDSAPGIALPTHKGVNGFNETEYIEKWGHPPVYHRSGGGVTGVKEEIDAICQGHPVGVELNDTQKIQLIGDLRNLYNRAPYVRANMWAPTRDWLRKQLRAAGKDPTIVPD